MELPFRTLIPVKGQCRGKMFDNFQHISNLTTMRVLLNFIHAKILPLQYTSKSEKFVEFFSKTNLMDVGHIFLNFTILSSVSAKMSVT